MAWATVSTKTERVKDTNPNTYIKRSEEALKSGDYYSAIKEIDEAILLSVHNPEQPIREKLRILDAFLDKTIQYLEDNKIDQGFSMLNVYLSSSHHVYKKDEYIKGIDKVIGILFDKTLHLLDNENIIAKVLGWIKEATGFSSNKQANLNQVEDFIIKYINRIINNCNNEEDAINKIQKISRYSSRLSREDIESYRIYIYKKSKNYDKMISYVSENFDILIKSPVGKQVIDQYKDFIHNNCHSKYIDKLNKMLMDKDIPAHLLNIRFHRDFNSNDMLREFKRLVRLEEWETAQNVLICIKRYFKFFNIDRADFKQYCLRTKDYVLGMEYFKYHMGKDPKSVVLINEVAEFIREFQGVKQSQEFFKKHIRTKINACHSTELLCSFIRAYELFCLKYQATCDLKAEFKRIEGIGGIIDIIYPMYIEKGTAYLEHIKEKLITHIGTYSNETIAGVIGVFRKNFNEGVYDEISLAQEVYNIGEFEKSLFVLNNISYSPLTSGMKESVYQLFLNNYLALHKYHDALGQCEVLLSHFNKHRDEEALEAYVEIIIKLKDYDKGLIYLNNYINTYNVNNYKYVLIQEKVAQIEKYLSRLYKKNGQLGLSIIHWSKSRHKKRNKKVNKKKLIGCSIWLILFLGTIGQYVMYVTGFLKPFKTEPYMDFDNLVLERNEEFEYDYRIGIRRAPSYSKNPQESIVIENPSIIELRDGYFVGVEEGQTDVVLYMDETEVGRRTVKVEDIQLESYKIRYDGDLNFIGDEIWPYFEYNSADGRTKGFVAEMVSNRTDVVKVKGGRLVAVGVGEAYISITIEGITKTLIFNVAETSS